MKPEPLDPLDPSLAALVDSLRGAGPPRDALDRVWSRIAVAPPIPASLPTPPSPAHAWLASHAVGALAATFVAGGAAGAALHASVERPPRATTVYVDRPVAAAAPAEAPRPKPETPPLPSPPSVVPAAPSPSPRLASWGGGSLAAERTLIEAARSDLNGGRSAHALVLLEEHAKRFPKAQLAEEREALVVQSLVTLGRYDEARAAAARFRAATPESLFLPAVEASVGSIP